MATGEVAVPPTGQGRRPSDIPRSTFLQVPLPVQTDRLGRGRKVLEELAAFSRDKFQMEEQVSLALLRASRLGFAENEIPQSSVQKGLLALRRYCALGSRHHAVLARKIQEQVHHPLDQVMSKQAEAVMRGKISVSRAQQQVAKANERLTKAKRQLNRLRVEERGQVAALNKARDGKRAGQGEIDWLTGKVARQKDLVQKAEEAMRGYRSQLLQSIHGRDDVSRAASRRFEGVERERVMLVSECLRRATARVREYFDAQARSLADLEE
ncbi:unnamed protein product, partial [Discosporangium mesarthrocarpum]